MTTKTETTFDLDAFVRGWGSWDMDALLSTYAEDVEMVQIDRDNPPSAPRVRRGRETVEAMARHCAGAGVKATVDGAIADGDRGAASIACEFPGGREVLGNSTFELRDGLIVRQVDVVVGDAQ
jgi:hypothetical protein